jgi:LmbE family N-acetylglucosaminyl deacetylase
VKSVDKKYNGDKMKRIFVFILPLCFVMFLRSQSVSDLPGPDERFKTDLLLVLAHPDDETAIGSYLAKVIFDDRKKVSAIYLNRGNGGGNSIGFEQSMALANIREIEVRTALAKFGISNVWILDGKDTPGQDVFHSLYNAGHGRMLENIVRLIRLTRPEIIITWMPIFVAGENHGDHQAAGVIATEAFDLAADPTVFPTQVAVPRDRRDINNFQEGLKPWQPKKLYFFSDREEPIGGTGPQFDISASSKSKKVPYYQLAAELHTPHLVQGDVAEVGIKALEKGDFTQLKAWLSRYRLVFGKSNVPCKRDGDVFEGIRSEILDYQPPSGYRSTERNGLSIEPGGAFAFYKQFWHAHGLIHLADLVQPEIMIAAGSFLQFPLLITNYSEETIDVVVEIECPDGWQPYEGEGKYKILPDQVFPAQSMLQAPFDFSEEPVILTWKIKREKKLLEEINLTVHLREWTLPQ